MQKFQLEQLMQKLKQGDKKALEEIYNLTQSAVFATLLSVLREYYLAEDAMQNTYIKIYSAIDSYRDKTNPFAWIITIAKNEALMIIRKRKKETYADELNSEAGYADSGYVNIENKIVLNTLLNKLNEQEREIVLMHDSAGLKHREIAGVLGKPLGSVLWRYNNAFKKLTKFVNERGDY